MAPKVTIEVAGQNSCKLEIEYQNGTFVVDYPIRYPDGSVGYNWPERVPEYAKRQVEKFLAQNRPSGRPDLTPDSLSHVSPETKRWLGYL